MSEVNQASAEQARLATWQKIALGGIGCALAGAGAALPLAATHTITESVVHDDAGPIPTDISLAPGHSEIDFGIAGKLYNQDLTAHGLGMDVKITGPPSLLSTIASGKSPQVNTTVKQYADFYGNPRQVKTGYQDALNRELRSNFWSRELELGLPLMAGFGIVALASYKKLETRQARVITYGAIGSALLATYGLGALNYHDWHDRDRLVETAPAYSLSNFAGTKLAKTYADNPLLAAIINNGKRIYDQEVQRETTANQEFIETAEANIDSQLDNISLPASGETMFLATSDIHENNDMIAVMRYFVQQLNEKAGRRVIAFVSDNGDNAYGEATAKDAIAAESKIGDGAPFYSINGNHDTDITIQQKKAAGIHVIQGKVAKAPSGITILGDNDPMLTKVNALFGLGGNVSRGDDDESEVTAGEKLAKLAESEQPTILSMHESHEAAPIVGIEDSPSSTILKQRYDKWFATTTDTTGQTPDEVPDLPAALVDWGHWHRAWTPQHRLWRVVNNSNGSWTLVIELGTAGGAEGTGRLTSFSTPWTPPINLAAMNLITINDNSKLVTKLQELTTSPRGEFTVGQAIAIGSPNGQPYTTTSAAQGSALKGHDAKPKHRKAIGKTKQKSRR